MKTKDIKKYILILFGCVITSAAISLFFVPNRIVNGGVSGIATILYYTLGIPTGVSNYGINIILLLFGYKFLGKDFVVKTVICSGIVSVFVQIFSYFPPITTNTLLAAVFGAAVYGFGIGLTLANGASTGGTDIVGRLIQHAFPHASIGTALLITDAAVITAALIVFGEIDLVLYGIGALSISSYSIDWLIRSLNISKLAFIISEHGEEISDKLISTSPRGVTRVDVIGGYTNEKKEMLVCALKSHEVPDFQKKILLIDPDAFIIFSESQQIVGNGFRVYH